MQPFAAAGFILLQVKRKFIDQPLLASILVMLTWLPSSMILNTALLVSVPSQLDLSTRAGHAMASLPVATVVVFVMVPVPCITASTVWLHRGSPDRVQSEKWYPSCLQMLILRDNDLDLLSERCTHMRIRTRHTA